MTIAESSGTKHVDMDKMVISMTKEMKSFWLMYDPFDDGINTCPIYRVPEHIRDIDRISYEPIVISIGPYHHGAHHLQDMERQKWQHLDGILKLSCERTLNDYIRAIADVEKQARKCYSEDIEMERKRFVQMLLLDACFLLANIDENVCTRVSNSRILGQSSWLTCSAWHDVLLLENQIPFFVMESVCKLVAGQGTVELLRSKAAEFVEDILGHYPKAIQELDRPKYFHHLLHLCHTYFRPSQKFDEEHQFLTKKGYFHGLLNLGHKYLAVWHKPIDAEKNSEQMDCFQAGKLGSRWRPAMEYHRAGVQFKRRDQDVQTKHSLLDIRFVNGVLEVPRLPIDETTESLFKNLMALEQTDHRFGNDFNAYLTFMSHVIATTEDATIFVQKGIILHMMDSDEEVSALFTRLTRQVTLGFEWDYYLKPVFQALETHYQSRVNRWIAWLWLNHFVNPWLALAAFAAGVVLACTIIQTIYTVLAYVKPQ